MHRAGMAIVSLVLLAGSAPGSEGDLGTLSRLGRDGVHFRWEKGGNRIDLCDRQVVWTDLVSRPSQFLPEADLRNKLAAAGARAGVPVVSYCMVGMRASVTYFVARHLGFDAKMYDGSIVDWGQRKLPVRSGRP